MSLGSGVRFSRPHHWWTPILIIQPTGFRIAASRTCCTAGNSMPIKIPIIAITTKSSTSVNPRRLNCLGWNNIKQTSMIKLGGKKSEFESRSRLSYIQDEPRSVMFTSDQHWVNYFASRHRIQNSTFRIRSLTNWA